MKRTLALAAAVIATFAFSVLAADVKSRRHFVKRVTAVAIGAGAAATAAFIAINKWNWNDWVNASSLSRWTAQGVTTFGCAAVSPMIATVVIDRPLTNREARLLARGPTRVWR